jgi:hypothetical protein
VGILVYYCKHDVLELPRKRISIQLGMSDIYNWDIKGCVGKRSFVLVFSM